MLQLLDLARENAELRCELARIAREAEALRRLLSGQIGTERAQMIRVRASVSSAGLAQWPGGCDDPSRRAVPPLAPPGASAEEMERHAD
jgi:hypothetical protein